MVLLWTVGDESPLWVVDAELLPEAEDVELPDGVSRPGPCADEPLSADDDPVEPGADEAEEFESEEPVVSAKAIGIAAAPEPTPSATARAPT